MHLKKKKTLFNFLAKIDGNDVKMSHQTSLEKIEADILVFSLFLIMKSTIYAENNLNVCHVNFTLKLKSTHYIVRLIQMVKLFPIIAF